MMKPFRDSRWPGRFALTAGLLAAALLASLPVSAQTPAWKWRDAQGRLQYSDRPPPAQVPDKDILQRPSARPVVERAQAGPSSGLPASAASAAAQPRASATQDPALEARRKQTEAAEEARRKAEEDKQARLRQDNCQRAREHLRTLQDGQRITRTTPQGERIFLSDAERAQETARTRELLTSECPP